MQPKPARRSCAPMLTALALSLTACASNPPMPPVESPRLPPPPSLSTPLPSVSYSLTAAGDIKAWRLQLMGTRVMSGP